MLNATKKKKLCIRCQACCKTIAIPTKQPNTEAMKFYKARGGRLVRINGAHRMAVPSICPQLTKDGCKIYDNRPEDCKNFDGRKDPLVGSVCLWKVSNQGVLKKGTPRVKKEV